jgi:hypothetical protein
MSKKNALEHQDSKTRGYLNRYSCKKTHRKMQQSSRSPHSSPSAPREPVSPSHLRPLIALLSTSFSASKLAILACNSTILASFAFKASREMSLPLTMPCVLRSCLLRILRKLLRTEGGMEVPARVASASFVNELELSAGFARASLCRFGGDGDLA